MSVTCTFEASPVWTEVMQSEFALRPVRLAGEGHEIILWKHYLYGRLISTPFRDRVAVSWEGVRPTMHALARTLDASANPQIVAKDVGWFADGAETTAENLAVRYINADVALDANVVSRIRRTTQQVLRKSQRGTEPLVTLDDGTGLDQFYALYLQTRRRLGVLPYSRSFFRYWFDRIGEHSVVFKCAFGKTPVGFLLCYVHADEMIPSLITYNYEYRKYAITDLLHMHAFLWGRDKGLRNYRFGADNTDQDTLMDSKLKLGAATRPQTDYVRPAHGAGINLTNPMLRKVLRQTPNALFKHASLLTRLYFA